jgi:hypothetical protein
MLELRHIQPGVGWDGVREVRPKVGLPEKGANIEARDDLLCVAMNVCLWWEQAHAPAVARYGWQLSVHHGPRIHVCAFLHQELNRS